MSDSMQWVEIVFLAMLAGFVALRLVSVLGRRTGHERPAGEAYGGRSEEVRPRHDLGSDAAGPREVAVPTDVDPLVAAQLRDIAAADPTFDPAGFIHGARAAYGMVLEAFWSGDKEQLKPLVSDDIYEQFERAIETRNADGLTLENRIVDVDNVRIVGASLEGAMAEVTVRFDAHLVAITRNAEGEIVGGSTSDAVETHDVWTFSRHTRAPDPNWLLIETDAEA